MNTIVIYYHNITDLEKGFSYQTKSFKNFKNEMTFLNEQKRKISVVSFDDFVKKNVEKNNVIITFDDGLRGVYDYAFPVLKEYGLPFTMFIETSKIGADSKYITWEEIKEMDKSGLLTIGGHTHSHPDCSKIDSESLKQEITKSNSIILDKMGYMPKAFCFPYGYYNKENVKTIKSLNCYNFICSSFYGRIHSYRKFTLPRVGISDRDSLNVFRGKLFGFYSWKGFLQKLRAIIKRARNKRR